MRGRMVAPTSYPLAVSRFTLHGKDMPVKVERSAPLPSPGALTRLRVRLVVALLRRAHSDAGTGGPPQPPFLPPGVETVGRLG